VKSAAGRLLEETEPEASTGERDPGARPIIDRRVRRRGVDRRGNVNRSRDDDLAGGRSVNRNRLRCGDDVSRRRSDDDRRRGEPESQSAAMMVVMMPTEVAGPMSMSVMRRAGLHETGRESQAQQRRGHPDCFHRPTIKMGDDRRMPFRFRSVAISAHPETAVPWSRFSRPPAKMESKHDGGPPEIVDFTSASGEMTNPVGASLRDTRKNRRRLAGKPADVCRQSRRD
jgi:hypothetical protein